MSSNCDGFINSVSSQVASSSKDDDSKSNDGSKNKSQPEEQQIRRSSGGLGSHSQRNLFHVATAVNLCAGTSASVSRHLDVDTEPKWKPKVVETKKTEADSTTTIASDEEEGLLRFFGSEQSSKKCQKKSLKKVTKKKKLVNFRLASKARREDIVASDSDDENSREAKHRAAAAALVRHDDDSDPEFIPESELDEMSPSKTRQQIKAVDLLDSDISFDTSEDGEAPEGNGSRKRKRDDPNYYVRRLLNDASNSNFGDTSDESNWELTNQTQRASMEVPLASPLTRAVSSPAND